VERSKDLPIGTIRNCRIRAYFAGKPVEGLLLAPDGPGELLGPGLGFHALCQMRKTVLHNDELAGQIDQGIDLRFRYAKRAACGAKRLFWR
jgi:hypothetical protein